MVFEDIGGDSDNLVGGRIENVYKLSPSPRVWTTIKALAITNYSRSPYCRLPVMVSFTFFVTALATLAAASPASTKSLDQRQDKCQCAH
jgi:hypothetical protein